MRVHRLLVPSHRPLSQSRPLLHESPMARLPAREQTRTKLAPLARGKQPRLGAQPPMGSQICVHIGPVGASVSHRPLRHVLEPDSGHDAPMASGPRMSLGGTQMGPLEPKATLQV